MHVLAICRPFSVPIANLYPALFVNADASSLSMDLKLSKVFVLHVRSVAESNTVGHVVAHVHEIATYELISFITVNYIRAAGLSSPHIAVNCNRLVYIAYANRLSFSPLPILEVAQYHLVRAHKDTSAMR